MVPCQPYRRLNHDIIPDRCYINCVYGYQYMNTINLYTLGIRGWDFVMETEMNVCLFRGLCTVYTFYGYKILQNNILTISAHDMI